VIQPVFYAALGLTLALGGSPFSENRDETDAPGSQQVQAGKPVFGIASCF
jgi:hypothetical protein